MIGSSSISPFESASEGQQDIQVETNKMILYCDISRNQTAHIDTLDSRRQRDELSLIIKAGMPPPQTVYHSFIDILTINSEVKYHPSSSGKKARRQNRTCGGPHLSPVYCFGPS